VDGDYNDEFIVSRTPVALGRPLTVTPFGMYFFKTFDAFWASFGSHSKAALTEYSSVNFFRRLLLTKNQKGITRRNHHSDINSHD
jgi:hypothetical protein